MIIELVFIIFAILVLVAAIGFTVWEESQPPLTDSRFNPLTRNFERTTNRGKTWDEFKWDR